MRLVADQQTYFSNSFGIISDTLQFPHYLQNRGHQAQISRHDRLFGGDCDDYIIFKLETPGIDLLIEIVRTPGQIKIVLCQSLN